MSKKRVHELGKQLKEQGIELSNTELVDKLHALGYTDVKSHSSSLEDDQAATAYEKIVGERKPKPAPVKATGPGFVVRKKVHTEPPPAPVAAAPAPAPQPSQGNGHAPPPPAPAPAAQAPVELEAPAAPPAPAAEPLAADAPLAARAEAPAAEAQAPAAAPPPAPTPGAQPAPAAPPAAAPTAQPTTPSPAAPQRPGPGTTQPAPQYRPGMPSSQPQRPGAPQQAPAPMAASAAGAPKPPGPPAVDPRTLRPTSTQAVVISRPTVPVRRVTPPTTSRSAYPVAPGPRALGPVRELKVVPGMLGREREFIDVSKDKNKRGRGTGRPADEAAKSLTGKELLQAAMGDRAYIPIRGKKKRPTKKGAKTQITEKAEHKKIIRVEESISVSDLSQLMGVKAADLIRKLMQGGKMATINQLIDADTAAFLATEFGYTVEKKGFEVEEYIPEVEEDESKLALRPPVVTVMGHVDHGKTSLLDAIRAADVAADEAGGITQHIGAYSVNTPAGYITFLDTPGHEAFTAMRQRGAQVTDLVVLVVAADDGVMPQTIESIKQAKAAGVTILVAINKIDKPGATPERVMQQLTEYELVPEQWGGTTIMQPVSARTKDGVKELLEYIALQSEVLELKANPDKLAKGVVIEAKLEKGRGPVATVLVQEGTLRVGDAIVTGAEYGRVRAMMNERGEQVDDVGPGFPVEVLGLSGVPTAGDEFDVVEDERAAKEVAQHRAQKERQKALGNVKKATLEDLFAKAKTGGAKELNVVIKADVQGSAEAVRQAFEKAATKKVGVKVLESGVGVITESDVLTAAAGKAVIIGFNTKPETKVEQIASQQGVKIRQFNIIYEAVDALREEMANLLDPIIKEKPLGKAEVRQIFTLPKKSTLIAGSAVTEGLVRRGSNIRVVRDRKVVYSGKIASLRRIKDDVREVNAPLECGIGLEFTEVKVGDVIDAYELEEIRPSLD
jgi:translation initiation factor IF-2